MTTSIEIQNEIIRLYEEGLNTSEIAEEVEVSKSTVKRIIRKKLEEEEREDINVEGLVSCLFPANEENDLGDENKIKTFVIDTYREQIQVLRQELRRTAARVIESSGGKSATNNKTWVIAQATLIDKMKVLQEEIMKLIRESGNGKIIKVSYEKVVKEMESIEEEMKLIDAGEL